MLVALHPRKIIEIHQCSQINGPLCHSFNYGTESISCSVSGSCTVRIIASSSACVRVAESIPTISHSDILARSAMEIAIGTLLIIGDCPSESIDVHFLARIILTERSRPTLSIRSAGSSESEESSTFHNTTRREAAKPIRTISISSARIPRLGACVGHTYIIRALSSRTLGISRAGSSQRILEFTGSVTIATEATFRISRAAGSSSSGSHAICITVPSGAHFMIGASSARALCRHTFIRGT